MRKELVIGCGHSLEKRVFPADYPEFEDPIRLDIDPNTEPDILFDLERVDMKHLFEDNTFDEIHAYHVLEHVGQQGDAPLFFALWSEFWRILKPRGVVCGVVPTPDSIWAWGDPGHKNIFHPAKLTFLDQDEYTKQVGVNSFADYRYMYRADFIGRSFQTEHEQFHFLIEAVKPSRISIA